MPQELVDRGPFGLVAGVNRLGADADAPGGLDLVAHQREERRDQERRPASLVAQEPRAEEVEPR